jgi:LysW-gamma-L-lysine carboxypeptidase
MGQADAIALLHDMVAIPSPSGAEAALARHLEGSMRALGFHTRLDEVGNLIGELGAGDGGPTVLLLGHMDTIARPMRMLRHDGRLHGRGTVDAKGPLAAMICAAASRPAFPGRLQVAAVVEEETPGSRGAAHLVRTLPAPDVLLVGEPSGWSGVVLGYKGQLLLAYRVVRPAAHPSGPGEKAAEVAIAFWAGLQETLGPDRGHGFERLAATLLAITGDMTQASLDVDVRLPPGLDVERLLAGLRTQARGGELRVVSQVPPVLSARGNRAARSLSAGIRRRGGTPRPTAKTGTSDMNTVAPHWDVPMAAYGPGDSRLDHSDDEHIELDEYLRAIDVLSLALDELAREGKGRSSGT